MSTENILEVINKLVGAINPVGESHTDGQRFENLKVMCDIVNDLVRQIDDVSYRNRDAYESSIQKASKYANTFLSETLGIKE